MLTEDFTLCSIYRSYQQLCKIPRHCINYFIDCFTIDESNQVKISLEIKWHQGNFLIALVRGWIDVKACIYLLVALLIFVCYLQLSRHFICWYMMVLSHFQWIFCWLIQLTLFLLTFLSTARNDLLWMLSYGYHFYFISLINLTTLWKTNNLSSFYDEVLWC